MRIVFIHSGLTQFKAIHNYINSDTESVSWLLCSRANWKLHKDKIPNLIAFDDAQKSQTTNYYIRDFEVRVKRSFAIKSVLSKLLRDEQIDVAVVHGSGGFPLQLFDEIPIPIVSYIEFPSFRAHGHDKQYPPPESKVYRDKIYEMGNYNTVLKSNLVIVPSLHAKRMFPTVLHSKIRVQMDGISLENQTERTKNEGRRQSFSIGFIARDISSAKGIEHFIATAKEVHRRRPNCRFIVCGSKKLRYSYEDEFMRKLDVSPTNASFLDYLLKDESASFRDAIQHVDFLDYKSYDNLVHSVDLVLYPLQFGSANWGIFECMLRKKKIIASNRCFIPEIITDGYNGVLRDYGDIEGWVKATTDIIDDPSKFEHLGENACEDANRRFHASVVANKYLSLLGEVVSGTR